jgi:hypothetical protein
LGRNVTWLFLPLSIVFLSIGLGSIPSFESMECESRATARKKMKDFHMQRHLVGEQLFVGQDVNVTNGDDHASCDGVLNRIVHKTCDNKDVHPCVTIGEDGQ